MAFMQSFPVRALVLIGLTIGATIANPVAVPAVDPCSLVRCMDGYTCKVIGGAAKCVANGVQCGPKVCRRGEVCCNESCGICTKPDEWCTLQFCLGPQCGSSWCASGEVCCNESCGICTPPGGVCTQQACLPTTGPQCGPNTCAVGEVCCNESCGICTPPDGACIDLFCGRSDI
jgi:hypothetical protein